MSRKIKSPSRRELLGTAAVGAAASLLPAPWIWSKASAQDGPVVVGLQAEMTGALAHDGYWIHKATAAGVKYLNENGGLAGRQVKLVTADTETKVDVGVRRMQQLAREDKADFIIGAEHGGIASASVQLVKDFGIPYISFSRTDAITTQLASPLVYRLDTNTTIAAKAAAEWMVKNVGKRWSIVVADYAWGHSHRDSWGEHVKKAGGEVLQSILLPINTSDPLPYLLKIDRSADVIFLALLGPDSVRVFPALKNIGLGGKAKVTAGSMLGLFDVLKLGEQVEGVWALEETPWELADMDTPHVRRLFDAVGIEPNGREKGTGDYVMFGDVFFAWQHLGFIKRNVEGSGWKSQKDTMKFIEYADANPNYEAGPLLPIGPMFVRPEDHQGFCDYSILQIEGGRMKARQRIPMQATIYPAPKKAG